MDWYNCANGLEEGQHILNESESISEFMVGPLTVHPLTNTAFTT